VKRRHRALVTSHESLARALESSKKSGHIGSAGTEKQA